MHFYCLLSCFLSTSQKQLFCFNTLLTTGPGDGDLLEGFWTVLFGHPLPFDVRGRRKTASGAPQRGAAAVGVDVCVRSHLLLDYMRRYCRTDGDVNTYRRKLIFLFNLGKKKSGKLAIDQQLQRAPLLLFSNSIGQNHSINPSIRFCDSTYNKVIGFLPESVIILQRLAIF